MAENPYKPMDSEPGKQTSTPRRRRSLWCGAAWSAGLWVVYLSAWMSVEALRYGGWLSTVPEKWTTIAKAIAYPPVRFVEITTSPSFPLPWHHLPMCVFLGAIFYGTTGGLIQLVLRPFLPRRRDG